MKSTTVAYFLVTMLVTAHATSHEWNFLRGSDEEHGNSRELASAKWCNVYIKSSSKYYTDEDDNTGQIAIMAFNQKDTTCWQCAHKTILAVESTDVFGRMDCLFSNTNPNKTPSHCKLSINRAVEGGGGCYNPPSVDEIPGVEMRDGIAK